MKKLSDSGVFYYIALMIMMQESQDSILPEVCHILSPKQIFDFVSMFEGEKVKVPTREELSLNLTTAMFMYYYKYMGLPYVTCKNKMRLSDYDMLRIEAKMSKFEKGLKQDTGLSIEEIFHV